MSAQVLEPVGNGTIISYDPAGGTSWTAFANIVDIPSTHKKTAKEVDTSALNDTAKKSQPSSQPDSGELHLTIKYVKATASIIAGWMDSQTIPSFKIATTESTVTTFNAWVKEFDQFGGSLSDDHRLVNDLVLRLTGPITIA